ncbi:HEAT repeat-containing protein 6 [Drosophila innubila]|uniref:HEAT repeat-containing protein 6 n=1 Tax=Drosophila innubila TaxID=198719 RepID=UPI00148DC439|nr:HEAT repeat-containing protein 6 [Drosophila innubila]
MEKEKRAYDVLIQTINTRVRSSRTADNAHIELQLQFLRDIEIQTSGKPDGVNNNNTASQLAELLTEAARVDAGGSGSGSRNGSKGDESLNLNAWLLWLHELLLSRRQLLGDTEPLLEWLLQRVEQQQATVEVDALRCLLSLLEALPAQRALVHFPRLAAIPMPVGVEAALLLMLCQDTLLGTELKEEQELQLCSQLANTLLQSHYDARWTRMSLTTAKLDQLTLLVAHSLQLLQKIATQHADYAQEHAPELIGLALAYVRNRTTATTTASVQVPHRVQPAQQAAAYGQEEEVDMSSASNHKAAAAGRRVKSRKMRSLTKQRNNANANGNANANVQGATAATGNEDRMQLLLLDNDCRMASGDSEGGCTPTSDGAGQQLAGLKQQRQCQVKVRLAALQLLGAVTKQLPRRSLYGYWHALFPSAGGGRAGGGDAVAGGGGVEEQDHLLHIGASDGNVRCRAQALQLAAQLLYGSKPYLSQASSTSAPSNYTPFAMSLASSVLEAYRQLTAILEREYAPPVLTQCLKCLAVLVQATPFDQLQMGFVYEFVPHVKKLARHVDTGVKVSALLVMEMLLATPRLTQEMACAVGLPISERRAVQATAKSKQQEEQQFQQLCDSDEEEEAEEEDQEQQLQPVVTEESRIPRNSWLLRLVLRYLDCPASASPSPLRVECLQVILAMSTHFALLRDHLSRLSSVLCTALEDASLDVRLYGARCLDAVGFQMARHAAEQPDDSDAQLQQQHLGFWLRMLQAIYVAHMDAGTPILKSALCDALSNMGVYSFERLPQAQRNGLLAFLLGCSSDDAGDHLVRAAALRALAVYVLHPTLRSDLVFVEHTAELALRLIADNQLAVRIKAAWALGNISDALVAPSPTTTTTEQQPEEEREQEQGQEQERISQTLLSRLIEAAVVACSDHDKVRANAVRALGNLLRLLPPDEHGLMQRAMSRLLDCVRAAGSAKVKWNACYAIGNLVRNRSLFSSSASLAVTLYATLSQLIVQHANFKVRINATAVLLQIEQRADFGVHYATMWRSLLAAIERSNALDTFEEYNHRDGLQQQLCLAMAHMLARARPDDLSPCRAALESQLDVVSATWRRVAYRIVPEQAAPLFTCGSLLQQRLAANNLTAEQRNALTFLADALRLES